VGFVPKRLRLVEEAVSPMRSVAAGSASMVFAPSHREESHHREENHRRAKNRHRQAKNRHRKESHRSLEVHHLCAVRSGI